MTDSNVILAALEGNKDHAMVVTNSDTRARCIRTQAQKLCHDALAVSVW